jgi:hypothetical protein
LHHFLFSPPLFLLFNSWLNIPPNPLPLPHKTQSTQSPNPFLTKFQGPAKHKSRPSSPRSEVLQFISSAHKTKECVWDVPEG